MVCWMAWLPIYKTYWQACRTVSLQQSFLSMLPQTVHKIALISMRHCDVRLFNSICCFINFKHLDFLNLPTINVIAASELLVKIWTPALIDCTSFPTINDISIFRAFRLIFRWILHKSTVFSLTLNFDHGLWSYHRGRAGQPSRSHRRSQRNMVTSY